MTPEKEDKTYEVKKCCDTCRYSTNNSILPHNVCENHSRWEPKEPIDSGLRKGD